MSPSPSGQDLWELFLEEAAAGVTQCLAILETGQLRPQQWNHAAGVLETLEAQSALMGVPEVCELARVSKEVCLRPPEDVGPLVAALLQLRKALNELLAPDASGAHLDPAPLRAAVDQLLTGSASTSPIAVDAQGEAVDGARGAATPPMAPDAEPVRWQVDEDMVEPFIEECNERIESLGTGLVQLESTRDPELVRSIFRDLHTLKGSSGFVGLKQMNRLAHAAEDLVGEVRDSKRSPDRPVIDALLAALDGLKAILDRAVSRSPIDVAIDPLVDRLRSPELPVSTPAPPIAPPPTSEGARPSGGLSLRVDFDKLDLLLNLVGELVLGKAGIHEVGALLNDITDELESQRRRGGDRGERSADPRTLQQLEEVTHGLENATGRLDMVSAELRDQVMKLRMVPIAGLFNKYRRVVRDLSHSLGKDVTLSIEGAETELDKLLVEQLDDPLLHLVRNAVDHGVEPLEQRRAAGKSESGHLLISASHRGHQIVIEVADDGAGIDAERVGQKARSAGLVTEEELARMDHHQLLELVFLPGLSTAHEVTGTSGRGVGMDVVREAIMGLKGGIEIDSTPDKGTRFTLNLPLTLAISNVLLCRARDQVLAVPIHAVKHTLMADPERTREIAAYPTLRLDEEVPLIDVSATLGLPPATASPPFPVALVESLGGTFGLVFDQLLGRQEIVIKSLGSLLERVPCCAGATLLGERCALILDVPALIRRALESPTGLAASGSAPSTTSRPPTILVAEDSDTVREDLRRLLTAVGYRVQEAREGTAALELASRQDFDLVSTDVMMPGMDGYELCRRLRQIPAYETVPIIMLTSRDQEIDRIQGFDAGVDAYLVKPVDHDEMTAMVRRLLEASSREDGDGGPE